MDRSRATRQPWSSEEIAVVVDAYFWMLGEEVAGRPFVKVHCYRKLHEDSLTLRSVKAIEFKMQNISAVFKHHGLSFITGLAPLRNVQTDLAIAVEERLLQRGCIDPHEP